MKLIKHEYDTLDECLHAMIDGVVFWHRDHNVTFSKTALDFRSNAEKFGLTYNVAKYWKTWQIQAEPDWRDDLSEDNRIPCIVWDDDDAKVMRLDYIHTYISEAVYPYRGNEENYKHATPLQEKDCWRQSDE